MPTDAGPDPDGAAPARAGIPPEVRDAPFPYMRWAKLHLDPADPDSLGLSGVPWPAQLDVAAPSPAQLGDVGGALRALLGARYGLAAEHVHLAAGSSSANFIVYHTLARGGRVAAETPAYEALHVLAPAVSASLTTFRRRRALGWRIDPDSLDAALRGGVDLLVVTDLHNPSGMALHPDDLDLLVAAAEQHDAYVLVDEVYLDFDPAGRPSAATRDARVVATNSLTKCHGFGSLRAGWVLGAPDVIRRLEEQDDIVCPVLSPLPLHAAVTYLERHAASAIEQTRTRAREACDAVDAWVEATPGVSWLRPDAGITGFLDLDVDGSAVCERLAAEHGVRAVPGAFFQRPHGVRVSFLLEPAALEHALAALGKAIASVGADA